MNLLHKLPYFIIGLFVTTNASAQQTVGLFTNTEDSFDGLTMFANTNGTKAYLIDNCGELVHSWEGNGNYGPQYLYEDGNLLRVVKLPMGGGSITQIVDWNSNILWEFQPSTIGYGSMHHDIEPLPNGNVLIIVYDAITDVDVDLAGGVTNSTGITAETIIEVEPNLSDGTTSIVWEWRAWDHIIQEEDNSKANYGIISENPGKINLYHVPLIPDWLHFNAIDYSAELDQILVSSPNFNEVWIIDHSTNTAEASTDIGGNSGVGGDLMYRWGNPIAYGQGANEDQQLFFQHDAQFIQEPVTNDFKFIVYNNRASIGDGITTDAQNGYSSVDIIDLPELTNGMYGYNNTAYEPLSPEWRYLDPVDPYNFYSNIISGAQMLENGNLLICEGVPGRLFEVDTATLETVWEYVSPISNGSPLDQGDPAIQNKVFRCTRYSRDYPAFDGKDLTPQGVIEIGGTTSCDIVLSENEIEENDFSIYPNPCSNEFRMTFDASVQRQIVTVEIWNMIGQLVKSKSQNTQGSIEMNVSDLDAGIYVISYSSDQKKHSAQLVVE